MKKFIYCILFLQLFPSGILAQDAPNILWIITDDHRPDAIETYNQATTGKSESPLGYVSSPNIDKLAEEGTMFVNAFCNSPACGPSRGSIISGRYPFRNGHYAFEQTHQNPDFVKPTFPQTLQKEGYITAVFGKTGSYIYKWGPGQGFRDAGHYNYVMHFKHSLQKNGVGDLWTVSPYKVVNGKGAYQGVQEHVKFADGRTERYYLSKKDGTITNEDVAKRKAVEKELGILRSYTRYNKNLIIGGQNPMPAGQTVDAKIVEEFKKYLSNSNSNYITSYGEQVEGANDQKPLMVNLGFHLPHTPILPPKSYRDEFRQKTYKVPEFDENELGKFTPQLKQLHRNLNMSQMTDAEKQQAIQDYYAFCAYGDALIGEAVEAFKEYCMKNSQEYLIVFTVGDHGWQLGEQGIEAKFGPWKQSTNGAIIMVSSDKNKVPEGKISQQLIEYVDIAPTLLSTAGIDIHKNEYDYLDGLNLLDFIKDPKEKRDYTVGEINLVAGPRAYMRSENFSFSMRTRPTNRIDLNKDIKWALECPAEKAELALYDLRVDPLERNNVAMNGDYRKLADWFRNKLGSIVLGDGRVECDWSKANTFDISNFAKGAHDRRLNIPKKFIPKL
ncbi:sulfatase-like hydrolase/transferase [uncultured Zobellia sp.]|uniref:sulfatase-like hydrolase/transferase n=1 Tax=uncultured Zobellia sp. TaxID=255433 RepID=UPI0025946632|nr:sulfatase-like hydrolase/transferase [uncultured Zobellia sp.]